MNKCNIFKFPRICPDCGKVLAEEEDIVVKDLAFVLCAPDHIKEYLGYISKWSKISLIVIGNERRSGQIEKVLDGKDMSEVVYVSGLIVGPDALKALSECAVEEDGNIEATISRILNVGVQVLSEGEQPVA